MDFEEYEKVDLEEAINRLHLSEDFLRRLINKFLNGDMMDKAEESFANKDLEEARIAIHSIKGASANIGLTRN